MGHIGKIILLAFVHYLGIPKRIGISQFWRSMVMIWLHHVKIWWTLVQ